MIRPVWVIVHLRQSHLRAQSTTISRLFGADDSRVRRHTAIVRLEAIRAELQQAESMDPVDAKVSRDEAMLLLVCLKKDLDLEDGNHTRLG